MERKRNRRICRVLYAIAVALDVLAFLGIIACVLCFVHGKLAAILPLAFCIGLLWVGNEMGEAAEKRI